MAINLESYRFRGMRAEGTGEDLEAAIDDLADFWDSRPSLGMHAWGVMTLEITVGTTVVTVEISDPKLLDQLHQGNLEPLIDKLAADMHMDRPAAVELLNLSTSVTASVDRIRVPSAPNAWSPDPGTEPEVVMPQAALAWTRDLSKEVDREARRDKGRIRTRRGRTLLRLIVEVGRRQGLTDAEIARSTGLPRSTIRDARFRVQREKKIVKAFQARRPGQRFTVEQRDLVIETLQRTEGNAAATARDLGIAPRTVRDIRRRAAEGPRKRRRYTPSDKKKLFTMIRKGKTATEAGRELGVPGRTARGWARAEQLRKDKT